MKRSFLFFIVIWGAHVSGGVVEDVSPQRGRPVAPITFNDETGRVRRLSDLAGFPVILLPLYTRCQTACVLNVDQLKRTLTAATSDSRQFRVLLFSFDSGDTSASLAKYRQRANIPLSWLVASASPGNIDALLNSIGFQVGKAGTEFAHANVLIFLDSNLRIAKWIYGTDYSARDIDLALKVAAGEGDWIGQHPQLVYALLLFTGSILCVALSYCLLQLRLMRRATRLDAANRSVPAHS